MRNLPDFKERLILEALPDYVGDKLIELHEKIQNSVIDGHTSTANAVSELVEFKHALVQVGKIPSVSVVHAAFELYASTITIDGGRERAQQERVLDREGFIKALIWITTGIKK